MNKNRIGPSDVSATLSQGELFELIGRMLFKLQAFERLFARCTGVMIATQRKLPVNSEIDAAREIWTLQKRPCGVVASQLRTAVYIDPAFDNLLMRLVRRRNSFVHKLSRKSAFNPWMQGQGSRNIAVFVRRLNADVDAAWEVFANYSEAIVRQADGDTSCFEYEKLVVPFLKRKPPSS